MLFLLLSGLLLSLLLFAAIHSVTEDLMDEFFKTSDYIYRSEAPYIRSLEEYIAEENIPASDAAGLESWASTSKVQYLMVSRDRKLLYDSLFSRTIYADQAESERIHWVWQYFYTVRFSDGDADVFVYDRFEEKFFLLVTSLEVFFCVFAWLALVFFFLRKDLRFILSLNKKVSAFTGGRQVDFSSPDRTDELGMLADGLDKMARELLVRQDREAALQRSRDDLLIGLAHDLRTPLTTLIAELSLAEKQEELPDASRCYIQKAHQKALYIKDLANQLFESFQIHTTIQAQLEDPAPAEYAVGDPFSTLFEELQEDGFAMQVEALEWKPVRVRISNDYMDRIIENLASNVRQYARKDRLVRMKFVYDESFLHVTLSNEILLPEMQANKPPSTRRHGIGLQNVTGMMRLMGGTCQTKTVDNLFSITLSFPLDSSG